MYVIQFDILIHYMYSSVRLERCVNCTLVLGAVLTTVVFNKCENVTMVTACQSLHIRWAQQQRIQHHTHRVSSECLYVRNIISSCYSSSSHCKFYLCVSHCPLILGGNSHLMFGPHNTNYHQLEDHMRQCGLHPTNNQWNTPTIVGGDLISIHMWQLLLTLSSLMWSIICHCFYIVIVTMHNYTDVIELSSDVIVMSLYYQIMKVCQRCGNLYPLTCSHWSLYHSKGNLLKWVCLMIM